MCDCDEGYGAATDLTAYRAPDCLARTCPSGLAWSDIATDINKAHAEAECANNGICNRETGECKCFTGFTGPSCHRMKCPNGCSGHGRCYSMKQLASLREAKPLNNNTNYENREVCHLHLTSSIFNCTFAFYISLFTHQDTEAWDESAIYACLCDSTWPVGIERGETQVAEWFGPDCSLRKNDLYIF